MRIPGPATISDSMRYGFAVGKVRVLETRILGRTTYERLLDARDFHEQLRVLSDTHYGRYLDGAHTASDVERGLEEALDGFYRFLDEAKLPAEVIRFFRLRYDYANLKAKLRAEALGEPLEGMLSGLATAPPEAFEGSAEALPPFLYPAYERLSHGAEARTSRAPEDLWEIDAGVDRQMFADLLATAERSRSEFLGDLARLLIDVANIKASLRGRAHSLPPAEMRPLLVPGGTLPLEDIVAAYAAPLGAIAELASRVPLLRDVTAEEVGDLSRIDVIVDDIVVRFLRDARLVPIGAEPVIAYVMAREAEVVALRILLIGKLAGVPAEALRVRLRDLYV